MVVVVPPRGPRVASTPGLVAIRTLRSEPFERPSTDGATGVAGTPARMSKLIKFSELSGKDTAPPSLCVGTRASARQLYSSTCATAPQSVAWSPSRLRNRKWNSPFAGLHQLCAPLLDRLENLPVPQRAALATAFGLTEGIPPDRFFLGLAVLSLLSEAAEERPLVCVVDDAQWLDSASSQVLAFAARRLVAESVALVFAAREPQPELAGLPGDERARPVRRRRACAAGLGAARSAGRACEGADRR